MDWVKNLGLHIDNRFNFQNLILTVCNRISKLVRFLRFSKQNLNESQRLWYYICFIKPVKEYGIIGYGCVSKIF